MGLASGYVVAYGVNLKKKASNTSKRIELIPTRKSILLNIPFIHLYTAKASIISQMTGVYYVTGDWPNGPFFAWKMAKLASSVHTFFLWLSGVVLEDKSPMVNIIFLNEWGDRQVSPYKPDENLTGATVSSKVPSTQQYAIFINEKKIKVCY